MIYPHILGGVRKALQFIFFLLLPFSVSAQTLYVDATNGNDAWSGSLPDSQGNDGPWRSLAKVNAASLQPGDSVLLKCGRTWVGESLNIQSSGSPGNPIAINIYGDCTGTNKPEIRASNPISGWITYSGNIWVANASSASQLFVDSQYVKLAQHPNSGYMSISANSALGSDSLVSNELAAITNQDLIGASAHIRTVRWRIEDRLVDGFDAITSSISLNKATEFSLNSGWGFYLDNKLWMLDRPGEWYFDATNSRLYLWMPDGGDPNTHLIEASPNLAYGIYISGNDIALDGLRVTQAKQYGIHLVGSNGTKAQRVLISNLDVIDSGDTGIKFESLATGTVQNSLVRNSVRQGIDSRGSGTGVSIVNNQVENSGTVGSPKNSLAAIHSNDNTQILNNTIINAGYIGIRFGRYSNITGNDIDNVCVVLDDCGGIYSWAGSGQTLPPAYDSIVSGNLITNALGNPQGVPPGWQLAAGIYIDDLTGGVQVIGNTVFNADRGIFLHNAFDSVVANNLTYGSRQSELSLSEGGNVPPGVIQGNTISGNTLFPLGPQQTVQINGSFQEVNLTENNRNVFSANHYSGIYSDKLFKDSYPNSQPTLPSWQQYWIFTLPQWQQLRSQDVDATYSDSFGVAPLSIINRIAPDFIQNGGFDAGIINWSSWNDLSVSGSVASVRTWQPNCVVGGCIQLDSGSTQTILISSKFPIYKDKYYLVKFDLHGSQNDQYFSATVRRAGVATGTQPSDAYESLGFNQALTIGTQWQAYAYVFKGTKTIIPGQDNENGARIDMYVNPGYSIYVDNVQVQEINVEFNDPADDATLLLNRQRQPSDMSCPDVISNPIKCEQYVFFDDGQPVAWPVNVEALSGKILLWAGNPLLDIDHDSVPDSQDACPLSPIGISVDDHGCSFTQNHSADISITLTDSPDPAVMSGAVDYTITVANAGHLPATNVTTSGSLPGCSLGTIPSGGSATCTRSVTATVAGTLTQSVSVSAAELDPSTNDNSATVSTNVQAMLTVSKTGSGVVASSPSGINCAADCTEAYDANTVVTLTATADANSVFGSWSGCDASSGTNCTVNINASRSVTANFPTASLPDLVHLSLSMTRSVANLVINDSVKNQGTGSASASTIHYYLSLDTTYQSGTDTFVCSRILAALAAGITSPSTGTTKTTCATPVVPNGAYYLLAIDDAGGNVIAESNEGNNVKATSRTLSLGAELASPSGTVSASKSGSTLTLRDRVKNQGSAPAGSFKVGFYLSTNDTLGATDVFVCGRTINGLGVSQQDPTSGTATTTCAAPAMPTGTYYVLAVDDYEGVVIESNETNNVRATSSTGGVTW